MNVNAIELAKAIAALNEERDRLKAVNKELLEALVELVKAEGMARRGEFTTFDADAIDTAMAFARRAIANAKGGGS